MRAQMMMAAGRSRLTLGQDLRLVEAAYGQIWLEGAVRLRPGQPVELIGQWPGVDAGASRARVVTWRVIRLTTEGPYYRGYCRLEM
jgi:hypothetical protein